MTRVEDAARTETADTVDPPIRHGPCRLQGRLYSRSTDCARRALNHLIRRGL
jgi:hypothetical protein